MHCSEFRILESRVQSKYLVIPSRRRANWGEPPFQVERLAKIRCRAVPEKYGVWSHEVCHGKAYISICVYLEAFLEN